jgi:hypothetical protein
LKQFFHQRVLKILKWGDNGFRDLQEDISACDATSRIVSLAEFTFGDEDVLNYIKR